MSFYKKISEAQMKEGIPWTYREDIDLCLGTFFTQLTQTSFCPR